MQFQSNTADHLMYIHIYIRIYIYTWIYSMCIYIYTSEKTFPIKILCGIRTVLYTVAHLYISRNLYVLDSKYWKISVSSNTYKEILIRNVYLCFFVHQFHELTGYPVTIEYQSIIERYFQFLNLRREANVKIYVCLSYMEAAMCLCQRRISSRDV